MWYRVVPCCTGGDFLSSETCSKLLCLSARWSTSWRSVASQASVVSLRAPWRFLRMSNSAGERRGGALGFVKGIICELSQVSATHCWVQSRQTSFQLVLQHEKSKACCEAVYVLPWYNVNEVQRANCSVSTSIMMIMVIMCFVAFLMVFVWGVKSFLTGSASPISRAISWPQRYHPKQKLDGHCHIVLAVRRRFIVAMCCADPVEVAMWIFCKASCKLLMTCLLQDAEVMRLLHDNLPEPLPRGCADGTCCALK